MILMNAISLPRSRQKNMPVRKKLNPIWGGGGAF